MEKSYTTVDKTSWPDGEWKSEPDKIQWKDDETGFPCLIVRNQMGALCGYVGVSESHPHYGKHYDSEIYVQVHGGLTFAGPGICRVPESGDPYNVWWFGFDCCHALDFYHPFSDKSTYKNVDYVKRECKKLAKQLFEINLVGTQS